MAGLVGGASAVLVGLLFACSAPTAPDGRPLAGTHPQQVLLTQPPSIEFLADRLTGRPFIRIRLWTTDSAAHLSWTPTSARISTSAGYDAEVLVPPRHCLTDTYPDWAFPIRFTWSFCDRILVQTSVVLSDAQQRELVARMAGRLERVRAPVPLPDAAGLYWVRVPTGRASTAEAIRRALRYDPVVAADVDSDTPWCVLSDYLPRPPCEPWYFHVDKVVSLGSPVGGDTIPIAAGGWVRITYVDSGGATLVTEMPVPP